MSKVEDALGRMGHDLMSLSHVVQALSMDFNQLLELLLKWRSVKERMGFRDRLIVEHFDKHGNLIAKRDSGWRENGLTNVGFAEVAGLILADVTGVTAFDYIAIGTGTTAFAATDTALEFETHREAGTGTRVTTAVTNDTAQLEHTFSGYTGTEAVTESGVLNAAAGGVLLCRQTFPALNIDWDAGDTLKITWKIQCKQAT